ncbi:hypothetical protein F3N43_00355 [Alkalilimnicola sp. S0819]|nr:hypothetical protein F3N43_00355 [Alkalilimnicola sp. S0819]MPQ15088.1 hypothetical protein [Alkalilimnicola sp. S0819]
MDPVWKPVIARWGAILWPSFLVAGVATMVFFANLDPEDLRMATFPEWDLSRRQGYTLGFFMFWAAAAASSWLSALLLTPSSRRR